MRIISGTFRSRALDAPRGFDTRPTSDRLRETLFNVLAPHIPGASFLDLYAGSGAVGIEALSRGALDATFVECSPAALKVLRGNLSRLGITSGFSIFGERVNAFLRSALKTGQKQARYKVIFLDPPYDAAQDYVTSLMMLGGEAVEILASGAVVIAEHRRKYPLQECYGRLKRTRLLEQGDAALSFFALELVANG